MQSVVRAIDLAVNDSQDHYVLSKSLSMEVRCYFIIRHNTSYSFFPTPPPSTKDLEKEFRRGKNVISDYTHQDEQPRHQGQRYLLL